MADSTEPPISEGYVGGFAQRFRKRPVEVDAVRVADAMIGAADAMEWLPPWLADAHERGEVLFLPDGVQISTLEGAMHAGRDDWIIRGVQGELYPCKPDIFDATYEAIEPDSKGCSRPGGDRG